MNLIYHFDTIEPPEISEKMLRAELKKRDTKRRATLLALAGLLTQLCLFLTFSLLLSVNTVLAAIGFVYVCVALCGTGVIIIVFTHKRRTIV